MNLILQSVAWLLETAFGQTIEPEQLGFFVGLYISLIGAYFFKNKLQYSNIPIENQLYFVGCLGLWLYYFLWGWLVILPLFEVVVCYVMMRTISIQSSTKFIFIFAMTLLSICHISMVYIQFNSLGEDHSADFTGPIMVITQRITSLAFSVKDGLDSKELGENQKKYAVRKIPSFPEYFAYVFNFLGVLCGPFVFYNDIMPCLSKRKSNKKSEEDQAYIAPAKVVFTKLLFSMVFIFFYWVGTKSVPSRRNINKEFIASSSLWYRICYLYISLFIARAKFYGAWLFADAIHNAAGVGYNGRNNDGSRRWDLVSNIDIFNIEFATGLKFYIDNWNITTVKWIRHVSYDRLQPKYRTLASFMLSALWHGFFPGYYVMFLTCHVYLLVQRKARRVIRPVFQTTTASRYLYDVVTFLATQLAIAYSALSFLILEWTGSMQFYKSVWFIGHFIGIFLFLAIPNRKSAKASSSKETIVSEDASPVEGNCRDVTKHPTMREENRNGHTRQR